MKESIIFKILDWHVEKFKYFAAIIIITYVLLISVFGAYLLNLIPTKIRIPLMIIMALIQTIYIIKNRKRIKL